MRLCILSRTFYKRYEGCSEILDKGPQRPYVLVVIKLDDSLTFAIPIRTTIPSYNKEYCYITENSKNSGLDFTKSLIISSETDLETGPEPTIEQSEFNYIKMKEHELSCILLKFVNDYKKYIKRKEKNPDIPEPLSFKFSTLQYFHKELGLAK